MSPHICIPTITYLTILVHARVPFTHDTVEASPELFLLLLQRYAALGLSARAYRKPCRAPQQLRALQHPLIGEVRQYGLMLAVELQLPRSALPELLAQAPEHGLLVLGTGLGSTVRLLPPLTLSDADAAIFVHRFQQLQVPLQPNQIPDPLPDRDPSIDR